MVGISQLVEYSLKSLRLMEEILQELKEIKETLRQHQEYHTGDGK